MPFDIPEPFRWDESFQVFYAQLDDEHKGLFDGIFDCAENRGDAGLLDTLYKKVDAHFKAEEALFSEHSYPDATTHKSAHDEFLGKLKGLSVPLDDATVNFAKNWLVQHIKSIDFKYKGKLG